MCYIIIFITAVLLFLSRNIKIYLHTWSLCSRGVFNFFCFVLLFFGSHPSRRNGWSTVTRSRQVLFYYFINLNITHSTGDDGIEKTKVQIIFNEFVWYVCYFFVTHINWPRRNSFTNDDLLCLHNMYTLNE